MSKNSVTLNLSIERGITNIGNLFDLKVSHSEMKQIKNLLNSKSFKGVKEFPKDSHCCILLFFIIGPTVGITVPLSIHFQILGLIGIGVFFLINLLLWYPPHASKINSITRCHDLALEIQEITNNKVKATFGSAGDQRVNSITLKV